MSLLSKAFGARSPLTGAAVGAAWGMVSSDTSILGGAAIGAGLGFGIPGARAGYRSFRRGGGIGGAGNAAWNNMRRRGIVSGALIGRTANKGYNAFSAWRGGFRKGRLS
jgi:hypothetical protein